MAVPGGGHSLKLYCPDSRVNIRAQFLQIRVIDIWNRLPPHIVTADTVASFVKGINSLGLHFWCQLLIVQIVRFFSLFFCCGRP